MSRGEFGLRVARWRETAGVTQQELATRAGLSKGYISMIENGDRVVDKRSTLDAIAAAMEVSTYELLGQPYAPTASSDLVAYRVVPSIRAALEEPDEGPVTPRSLAQLETAAHHAMAARMHCNMDDLGLHLPDLLAETRVLWFDRGNRDAGVLFVKAAITGSLALKAAGWVDLAVRLAELADQVATSVGDPICIAAAKFTLAQCALTTGARRRSARLANDGITGLDRLSRTKLPPSMLNDTLAWMGLLHLHAGLSEAALDDGDPTGHLAAADVVARHVTGDPWLMEFTRANVGTWAVGIALENGDPGRAPELARRVDPNDLVTPQRRSRLYLDAGRGHFFTGDRDKAIQALLAADIAAPGDLRSRATATEIVGNLVRSTGRRGGSAALRDLAVRVGIDPLNPPEGH